MKRYIVAALWQVGVYLVTELAGEVIARARKARGSRG